jgi:hypothetical protein
MINERSFSERLSSEPLHRINLAKRVVALTTMMNVHN